MYQITFLLACLLPYIALPVLRFPAQTQPWAALLGWGYVMVCAYEMPRWKISRYDAALVGMTGLMMVYVYTHQHVDFMFYLKKSAVFLFSVSIVFYARKVSPQALWTALLIAISVYAFFGLMQIGANNLYQKIGYFLVPLRNAVIGDRGVASLCPEATDFGLLSTFLLFFTLLLRRIKRPPVSQSAILALASVAALCVLSTKSGSGIVAATFMAIAMYASKVRNIRAIAIGITATAAVAVAIVLLQPAGLLKVRGIQLLATLVTSPATLIATTTFSYRFINNLVGLLALAQTYGLGYGAGAFIYEAPKIYTHYGLGIIWQLQAYYYQNVFTSLGDTPSGVFPMILLEYGLLGVALSLQLFVGVLRSPLPYRWAALVLMTLAWAQSFPVAWPPFWLLVGLSMNPKFAEAFRRNKKIIQPPIAVPRLPSPA